ncbi:MAG: type II secretion system protein [Opitutaceae bacterium]|jgi:prepilin-type N-terminal cleavage/methylation domain-containing protein/prepilin-type processing-associated H-X9-DG protein
MNPATKVSPAFTLVELLTVIAIIGALTAITIPVVGRARASAQDTTCKSNLHQLYLAVAVYAQDHRGLLPPSSIQGNPAFPYPDNQWNSALLAGDYIPSVLVNNDKRSDILGCPNQRSVVNDPLARTYGFNNHIGSGDRKLSAFVAPSRTLLIADGNYNGGTVPYNIMFIPASGILPTPAHPDKDGKANCVFLDGHVESRTSADTDDGIPHNVGATGSPRYLFWTGR